MHQYFSFNSPVWFNVGTPVAAAGLGLLHPLRRRLDGLDPELVQGGGLHLQGRLRRRPQPLPHPLLQGAALLRRHGVRPGLLHARRRRVRGHHQVRRRDPSRGEDGRPRRRPPRHRGVRRDQGARGGQDPRAARRRLRHGPRRRRHHLACSTRTPTTRSASPTSSCARSRTAPTFGLRGRKTGEVIETVDARELFRKIAKAAWECADPGLQYDDTINDWHTNPETGRITASNPCSEYMSLDNSSCNLASLNLLKFLKDDDTFDARAVRQGRRADHHRDGHLDLLRRLPDRGDRRDHPRLPPARHRLRQPRRAADGDGPRLRLRRRPRDGRGDHLADDRHVLQALGRARRASSARTPATPATPTPTSG